MSPRPRPIGERFWAKVPSRQPGYCWEWQGYLAPNGYGRFTTTNSVSEYSHRVAYTLEHGPIPLGLTIDHLCRNRACVNPAHLEAVPIRTNVQRGSRAMATACINGHPFNAENTGHNKGRRYCKICSRLKVKEYRERQRSGLPPQPRKPRARPTHCIRGHELSPKNTKARANGTRLCLECAHLRESLRPPRERAWSSAR